MKFKINNRTYEIKEVSQKELQEEAGSLDGEYFGLTIPKRQEIWLWKELLMEQKKITLYHELFHCYTLNYLTFNDLELKEDDYADISANSHDIIHEIVQEYFK